MMWVIIITGGVIAFIYLGIHVLQYLSEKEDLEDDDTEMPN